MNKEDKAAFADSLIENLTNNILPYWLDTMADPAGGYYGRRDGNDRLDAAADRGAILNARILWTFAAAARATRREDYRAAAERQYAYLVEHFVDKDFGGIYWSLHADGTPADTKKQYYAIAFAIYGLSEYVRLTGDENALGVAIELFRCIEEHSRDRVYGGYFEAATRDWQPIADMRLSDKDLNSSKTMNTHLHILEAYTNLLRVWQSEECREAATTLLELFNDVIVDDRTYHLRLFFDDDLRRLDGTISYGHDIEASWLMLEAAQTIGNADLLVRTKEITRNVALAALQGRCYDGSMLYERHVGGSYDHEKHWWVQAETVVGQLYLARYHALPKYWDMALETWQYILGNIVDRENGEWYWSRLPDGSINRCDDKAGFWKCPYHNARMCLEGASLLADLCTTCKIS